MRFGQVDMKSIMHYALPAFLFDGREKHPCFQRPAKEISLRDKLAVFIAYPPTALSEAAQTEVGEATGEPKSPSTNNP